jgi:AraC-like DNA-binding protein
MSFESIPLSRYPILRTTDPELARSRLLAVFGATSFDVPSIGLNSFKVGANHLTFGDVDLSFCAYDTEVTLGFGADRFVRQVFNIEGAGRWTAGNRSEDIARGSSASLLPAQVPIKFIFGSNYRHLILRIEIDSLRRYLGLLLGRDVDGALIFEENRNRPSAMGRLRQAVFQFALDYDAQGASFSDLATAEMKRSLIMAFLMYHAHNHTHLLLREPLTSTVASVRKVEEYIEANWDKPIDIEAMSAIAQVSARSLFRQFRKSRGYSPADFVKRVRLEHAREMLQQPDDQTSVTQVALKCGFQNAGHFARDYRLSFGELPSETLKRNGRLRFNFIRS